MVRIIDPPLDQLPNLQPPLTQGEQQVLDLFNTKLPDDWEIYVQPHLNGLRPDFVLLNPNVGIAVFEVKDWNLSPGRYRVAHQRDGSSRRFLARHRDGKEHRIESPVEKVRRYKNEIYNLYCPSLPDRSGFAFITAGIIFTKTPRRFVEQLLGSFYSIGEQKYRRFYPIAGSEDIASANIDVIFPGWKNPNQQVSQAMSENVASDLRGWLREPDHSREQREPLALNPRQRELATTRTATGYRRVKGPAGSGKTVAVAARADQLADEGKHVLVVSFNITLINYIRDLTIRRGSKPERIKRQIDFLHFHRWCRRVCEESGRMGEYIDLFKGESDQSALLGDRDRSGSFGKLVDLESVFEERLPELIRHLYDNTQDGHTPPYYDAILVDEGQDFRLSWWDTLRKALKPGGEMLLVADKTQNVYGTAAAWTDTAMDGAGFSGPWFSLETTYRLPRDITPILQKYADEFLTDEEIDIPREAEASDPADLRWVQINPANSIAGAARICVAQTRRQMKSLYADTANSDIVFLSQLDEIGRQFVREFEKFGAKVIHTFDEDDRVSRRQKLAFFKGMPNIKATTHHSFKGWESRHLVVYVDSVSQATDRALLYTALTRLKRHENGSALTVVSSCAELREFGETWPRFIDMEDNPPVWE